MAKKTFSFTLTIETQGEADDSKINEALVAQRIEQSVYHIAGNVVNTEVVANPLSDFESVRAFHNKFAVPTAFDPSLLGGEMLEFRQKFMQEELDEYRDATAAGDLLLAADALVDLVYVALGTADIMGLPWVPLFAEVQRANMAKERALRKGDSKRATSFDVIKPPGWTAPDHSPILDNGPWPVYDPKSAESPEAIAAEQSAQDEEVADYNDVTLTGAQ